MITLTVKRIDGSLYEVQYFPDAAACDLYITKANYPVGFTNVQKDSSASDTRVTQLQNAIANWANLTAQQKDTVLKVVLTHLIS